MCLSHSVGKAISDTWDNFGLEKKYIDQSHGQCIANMTDTKPALLKPSQDSIVCSYCAVTTLESLKYSFS